MQLSVHLPCLNTCGGIGLNNAVVCTFAMPKHLWGDRAKHQWGDRAKHLWGDRAKHLWGDRAE